MNQSAFMGDSLSVTGVALFKASVSFYRGTTPTPARKWLVLRPLWRVRLTLALASLSSEVQLVESQSV